MRLHRLAGAALSLALSCAAHGVEAQGQVPYTFANQSGAVPASQLDQDFAAALASSNAALIAANAAATAAALAAPLNSPQLTGTPTAPLGLVADASSQIATDAFVARGLAAKRPNFPYPPLSLPIHFAQMLGPTSLGAQMQLTGQVDWEFESNFSPQIGVNTMLDRSGYRMFFTPAGWTGTDIAWLYYYHPDWIVYQTDGATVAYSFNSTAYPPLDFTNPAVEAYIVNEDISNGSGHQGVHLDNVEAVNGYGYYEVYANPTIVPCPPPSQPACGGIRTPMKDLFGNAFTGLNGVGLDPAWTNANLAYLQYSRQAYNAAGLELWANLTYSGGPAFAAEAQALNGAFTQGWALHGAGSNANLAGYALGGFVGDGDFTDQLYDAEATSNIGWIEECALYNHDTNGSGGSYTITMAEEEYCTGFMLLAGQNFMRNWEFAGADISPNIEHYPPSMGGKSYVSTTGNTTAGSVTITGLSSLSGTGEGMAISGANFPPNDFVATITSSGTLTVTTPPTSTATGEAIVIQGFGPVAVGSPIQAPPSVTMGVNGVSTSCACGLCLIGDREPSGGYGSATDNGLCGRLYSQGFVVMNPVCEAYGYTLSTGSTSAGTITPSAGVNQLILPPIFNGATATLTYTPPGGGSPSVTTYTSTSTPPPQITVAAQGGASSPATVALTWSGGTPTSQPANPLLAPVAASATIQGPCTAAQKAYVVPPAPNGGSGNYYDMAGSTSVVASGGVLVPGTTIYLAPLTAVIAAYGSSSALPWATP